MAIANVMKYFNMTTSIAQGLIDVIGGNEVIYIFFIPIIGMLGSGLTGSTSTSNALFGGLHMDTASKLGLDLPKVAAAQVLGSTTGEMISPMNAIVVAAAVGLKDKEGILIKRMMPSFFLWLLICIATTFFFMYVL
jgi:lactate permease